MPAVRSAVYITALAVLATGCGADLGVLGGWTPRSGHAVAAGRLAASTKLGTPANEHGALIGIELESHAEEDVGSSWNAGLMLGYGNGPAAIDGRVGWELYGEFGTPLRQTVFEHGDLYSGLSFALPIRVGAPRHVADTNESTWVLMQRLEVVPLVRTRLYRDRRTEADVRFELSLGLSVRLRVFSDLL